MFHLLYCLDQLNISAEEVSQFLMESSSDDDCKIVYHSNSWSYNFS